MRVAAGDTQRSGFLAACAQNGGSCAFACPARGRRVDRVRRSMLSGCDGVLDVDTAFRGLRVNSWAEYGAAT